jgi:hypothetical protein
VALPSTINDREYGAFVESGSGIPAKRVVLYDAAGAALLTAAALADATANPTVGGVGAYSLVYNGTTWDRQRDGAADSVTGSVKAMLVSPAGNRFDAAAGQIDGSTAVRAQWIAASLFNGSSFDRQRSNVDTAALITASGATTSQTGADQTNYNGRGLIVVLDMTVVGTGSVTLTIQGKDAASGKYYTLLAGAAVVTNSTNVYTVYPGAPATANVSANSPLPRTWRLITTANNANATSYVVGASVIL